MGEKPQPVKVLYCGVCSLPPEYCKFGPDFEKCKPWLVINSPSCIPISSKKVACEVKAVDLCSGFTEANDKDVKKVRERLQSAGSLRQVELKVEQLLPPLQL